MGNKGPTVKQKEIAKVGLKGIRKQTKFVYRPKPMVVQLDKTDNKKRTCNSPKTGWNVQDNVISALKKSANKYVVLQDEEGEIQ